MVISQWISEYKQSLTQINDFYTSQLQAITTRIAELKTAIEEQLAQSRPHLG